MKTGSWSISTRQKSVKVIIPNGDPMDYMTSHFEVIAHIPDGTEIELGECGVLALEDAIIIGKIRTIEDMPND